MKKYWIHVIYLVLIVFFAVHSSIKAKEAHQETALAKRTLIIAEKAQEDAYNQAKRAKIQAELTAKQAARATQHLAELQELMKKCKDK